MKSRRLVATCMVAFLSIMAVMAKDIRMAVFKVSQMHCENCERKVMNHMKFEKGLKDLSTELKNRTVTITYDAEKTSIKKLQEGFRKISYEAEFLKETKKEGKKENK